MTQERLHALTDGIFAIVMTLMVLELKLPVIDEESNHSLWQALLTEKSTFISYLVSFVVLFVYWRAHNFVISIFAKNIDINILTFNAIFLFFVGLVPFTTHLSGEYNTIPLAIVIYAVNLILIGLSIVTMRIYISRAEHIENIARTKAQNRAALIRTFLPIVFAAIAIPTAFVNTGISEFILLFGVFYNLLNNASELTDKFIIKPINLIFKTSI